MDGVTVSVLGALVALAVAIVLILKKVQPTYAMLFGAVIGGLVGGAGLTGTVNYIISGTQGIVSAIIRIVTAGILAGALIESGAAERIAEAIMNRLGAKRCLIAITLATWVLTAVGVFGDVACITVAPIALQMAKRAGYHKMGVLMAQLGAVRAGNVMSPNPNAIAAAEGFNVPLTSIIAVGIIPAVTALVVTSLIAYRLRMRGTEIADSDVNMISDKELPPLWAALSGPFVTIALLLLRPIVGVTIDPMIALPVGGIVGAIAMGKTKEMGHYFTAGLAKMSGVAMLLIGTGALAGIISNSSLKDVIISFIEMLGLPGFMLAPISGMLMGAATASATAGTTLASQIFGPTVVASGVVPLAAAAMTHASVFTFDGLPHGSFFHVSAGGVNMDISERLKLLGYEAINGIAMMVVSTLVFGVFHVLG